MSKIISEKKVKARKEHICEYCGGTISKGEIYLRSVNVYDGMIFTWKCHTECCDIADALWNYVDPDDNGMLQDDFMDVCQEFCSIFICPDCESFDMGAGECKRGCPYCLDKIAEKLKTHHLVPTPGKLYEWKLEKRETAT